MSKKRTKYHTRLRNMNRVFKFCAEGHCEMDGPLLYVFDRRGQMHTLLALNWPKYG